MSGKKWTNEQIEELKKHYATCVKAKDLVEIIDRDLRSIYHKANLMKLKRETNLGNENLKQFGNLYRFKKNHEPWNKGLKGICTGGKETQFKKGNIPHNTKYFGKPYLYKRFRKHKSNEIGWLIQVLGTNKRLNYARVLWEQEHGAIPKNHIVYYLNGIDETKPPVIEDLGIMDRAKNMNRNTIHRYPGDLKKTIKILGKLKKQIDETDKLRCA